MIKKIDKNKINDRLFVVTLSLFIFQLVNREFNILLDIRYPIIILATISILFNFKELCKSFEERYTKYILVFYIFSFISFGLVFTKDLFNMEIVNITISLIVMYIYNLIMILFLISNASKINIDKIVKIFSYTMIFSFITATALYLIVYIKGPINGNLIFSNINGFVSGKEHFNLIGNNFRIGGYSEDPNFLSLNAVLFILLLYKYRFKSNNNIKKIIIFSISIFLFLISGSKTVLVTFVLIVAFMGVSKLFKIKNIDFLKVFIALVLISVVFGSFGSLLNTSITLSNRFVLWRRGLVLFIDNPILGSGISGYRHLGSHLDWVVHPHNTFIQVIAETGIIGLILMVILITKTIGSMKSLKFQIIGLFFLVYMLQFDISYTVYMVFIIGLLPILDRNSGNQSITEVLLLSNGLSNGGAERMVYDLANGLSNGEKFNVTLMLTDGEDESNSISDQFNINDVNFKTIRISNKKHQLFLNNFRVYKYIVKNKPDIIHTHQITLAYCVLAYTLQSNIIKIHTVHNDSHLEFGSKLFRKVYHLFFVLFNIKLVSISEYILQTSKDEYRRLSDKNHYMIYNGRSKEKLNENSISNKKNINKEEFIVIMIGRLTDVKNHIDAIEVFNIIKNEFGLNNVKLHIYGEGPCRSMLENAIEEYDLKETVSLMGISSKITEILLDSNLFYMTSVHEGFPISAIEALQASLPLVLSDFGSAYELIDGNGVIIQSNNYSEAATYIKNLSEDKEMEKKLGMRSNEISTRFSNENMVSGYSQLYSNEMEKKK